MKFFLFLLLVLVFVPVVSAQDSYTQGSETHCDAGDCTLTLYGDIRFIQERKEWVRVEDAFSLFGVYQIDYLQNDGVHDFRVVDYNYTSITLEAFITDSKEARKDIPIKIDGEEDVIVNFDNVADRTILKFESDEPITSKNYTIGSSSTTIVLVSPNLNILADNNLAEQFPNTVIGTGTQNSVQGRSTDRRRAILKFNISEIPVGQAVQEAYLGLTTLSVAGSPFINVHDVYEDGWDNDSVTWNNQPCSNAVPFSGANATACNLVPASSTQITNDQRVNLTVTSAIARAYNAGSVNASIILVPLLESEVSNYRMNHWTINWVSASYPNLTITYGEAPVNRSNVSIYFPENGQAFSSPATRINVSLNFTQNETDGDTMTYYVYFDGQFNQTVTTNTTMNFTEGSFNVTVNAHDGGDWGENDTVLFSFSCISAWECTSWVNNGTMDYRSCVDSSMCVNPSNAQDTERPAREQMALFFLILGVGMALIAIGLFFGEPLSIVAGGLLVLINAFMVMNGNLLVDSRLNNFGFGMVMILVSLYVLYKVGTGDE